jgi:hypothetical protein
MYEGAADVPGEILPRLVSEPTAPESRSFERASLGRLFVSSSRTQPSLTEFS